MNWRSGLRWMEEIKVSLKRGAKTACFRQDEPSPFIKVNDYFELLIMQSCFNKSKSEKVELEIDIMGSFKQPKTLIISKLLSHVQFTQVFASSSLCFLHLKVFSSLLHSACWELPHSAPLMSLNSETFNTDSGTTSVTVWLSVTSLATRRGS